MPHSLPKGERRHVLPVLSTHIVFDFLSEAASVSSLLVLLAALSILPQYRARWVKLAFPLFIAGLVVYGMWKQPSEITQALSVFMSVVILSFSMMISLKVAHILGLDRARSPRKMSGARGKFDPKTAVTVSDRAVRIAEGLALPAIISSVALLPVSLAAPVIIAALVILLLTVFWRIGAQTPKMPLDVRFRQNLRCFSILCLTMCLLLSFVLFWYIFGVATVRLEVALLLSATFGGCLVLVLLRVLGIPKHLKGATQNLHGIAFLISYSDFEKRIALSLLVSIFVFSDVPAVLLLYVTNTTAYAVIWAAGVIGLLASLVRSSAFQRTSLMIESNQISRAQVDAAIVRLATSYLAS
jgi:hypothetical protein